MTLVSIKCFNLVKEESLPGKVDSSCKEHMSDEKRKALDKIDRLSLDDETIAEVLKSPSQLGLIEVGINKHFYSCGNFNLIQLVIYVLEQIGPANVFISTYSIARDSLASLLRKKFAGEILDIKFLIDNRVRSISPKPFEFLVSSFPKDYRCCALHAKVALLWNDDFKIAVIGSQNATHNPKLERGIIHTDPSIWEFDYNVLINQYENGSD